MVAYSNAPYNIAFDVECSPQIVSNFDSMNGFAVDGRELVNLARPQPWIERILLENLKRSCRQSLLFGSHLAKARRNDLAARKRYFTPASGVPSARRPTRSPHRGQFRASPV